MPVAEWMTGEQVPAEVKWAWRMEGCPASDGRCTGHFVIYAYLEVVEERSTVLSTIVPWVDHDYYQWKILPIRVDENFKVRCVSIGEQMLGWSHGGKAYAADHCSLATETPAPSPRHVGEAQFQYAIPATETTPPVPETKGAVIHGITKLSWQQGIVLVSMAPGTGGDFDIPGFGKASIGATGGQLTAGPTHSITVDWTVTWHTDGMCTVATSPEPNTPVDEAVRIFRVRKSEQKLAGNPDEED